MNIFKDWHDDFNLSYSLICQILSFRLEGFRELMKCTHSNCAAENTGKHFLKI